LLNIAGITDKTGKIIGLMPHPERFIIPQQHPMYQTLPFDIPFGKQFFTLLSDAGSESGLKIKVF
ncbi:MAG: phosphoribosylformylglycinamidine synthase subunit PurQ, partial [Endomicrobia bacterium]|nr:phosphoribosylformylglycinamidine synthase subunit PurQ [Endomicrobiia bacterium]